jgi:hypothetical protein
MRQLLTPAIVLAVLNAPLTAQICEVWQPLHVGANDTVLALTTYDGELIAGGTFSTAGGTTMNHIARWNPMDGWRTLSSGSFHHGTNGPVWALTTHNGALVAGGSFSNAGNEAAQRIAVWNGQGGGWQALGNGLTGSQPTVHALTVYNGALIAGGSFSGSGQGGPALNRVAEWSGSWSQLSAGLNGTVFALTVYDNQLIAGGAFTMVPPGGGTNQPVNGVARWNGSSWQQLGTGMSQPLVYALVVHNGSLIAGGDFNMAGGQSASNLARWNEVVGNWEPLAGGANGVVRAMTVYNGDLFVAGDFTMVGGLAGIAANRIARLNGSSWESLDQGGVLPGTSIFALTGFNTDLIVGGNFATPSDQNVNRVARWQNCPAQPCIGDIAPPRGDGFVNVGDLLAVINSWGACPAPPNPCAADVVPAGGDGIVKINDLLAVINVWGVCP